MYQVTYYVDGGGDCPARDFIDSLESKMKAKVFGRFKVLKEYGPRLSMPYARHLEDGIYELRSVQGSNITRMLYFFAAGSVIVVTGGFIKKTQRTPKRELERAKRARIEWERRYG